MIHPSIPCNTKLSFVSRGTAKRPFSGSATQVRQKTRGPARSTVEDGFEAVSRMPSEEKQMVKALLEGMIVKHQTKQMVGSLSS